MPSATTVASGPAPGKRKLVGEPRGAFPVAQLAQHVGHAAEARVLHALGSVRLAEADRGGERVAGATVVGRDLVRGPQALVDLCRLQRELLLEGQREAGPDGLHPFVVLPALDLGDPLETEDAGAKIGAVRTPRLLTGGAGQLDRVGVVAGAGQVPGGDQPLGGGLAGEAVGGEGVRGDPPGGERALAVALELVDRGQAPLGVGEGPAGPLGTPCRDHLSLCAGGLGQLARQLRETCVALEDPDPLCAAFSLRPQVEGLAPETRGVPVGVHLRALADRPHERAQRPGVVARREPVGSHLGLPAVALLECRGQLAMKRAPAQPRHVFVDGVARERVTEGGSSGLELHDQTTGEELVEASLPAERGHQLDVEAGTGHRGRLGGRAGLAGQVARPQQDGVADRLRQRHLGGA